MGGARRIAVRGVRHEGTSCWTARATVVSWIRVQVVQDEEAGWGDGRCQSVKSAEVCKSSTTPRRWDEKDGPCYGEVREQAGRAALPARAGQLPGLARDELLPVPLALTLLLRAWLVLTRPTIPCGGAGKLVAAPPNGAGDVEIVAQTRPDWANHHARDGQRLTGAMTQRSLRKLLRGPDRQRATASCPFAPLLLACKAAIATGPGRH